jgi:hypothetical protein
MSRFSLAAESELRKMGWYPGRRVDDAQLEQWSCVKFEDSAGYLRIHPKAFHFLREFGGLRCDVERPGETCYREKFEINPDVEYSSGIFWFANELTLNENLFPIGFVEYDLIMMGVGGAEGDGEVTLWDVKTQKLLQTYSSDTPVDKLTLRLSQLQRMLQGNIDRPHQGPLAGDRSSRVTALAFSPDGKLIAVGETKGAIKIWPVP